MGGYLIDTNVVAELRKGDRANKGVQQWFDRHGTDELWLSMLGIGELRRAARLVARRDGPAGARLNQWIDQLVEQFSDRLLPVSIEVSEKWAAINLPTPLPIIDGFVAATALVHDLVLVTRHTDHLERSGVAFHNPFWR